MENSLAPSYVRINYTSAYGPHSMTIPAVPLEATAGPDPEYLFDLRGAAISVPVHQAIVDFVNVIKSEHVTTTTFVDYVLFHQPDELLPANPVASAALGIQGLDLVGGVDKATQRTFTWRATDFTLFKLAMLDVRMIGQFERQTNFIGEPGKQAISNYVTNPVTWVASRGGGRPNTFLQFSETLNEKLRRSYRMT